MQNKFQLSYESKIVARGYEMDSFGHINNSVYINYIEQARWEVLNAAGCFNVPWFKELLLVVTEMNVRYINEVKVFDELTLTTAVVFEEPYVVFEHILYNETKKKKAFKGQVKTIFVDKNRIIHSIPDSLLEQINTIFITK